MWSFIKNLFSKSAPALELSEAELAQWYDDKKKEFLAQIGEKVGGIRQQLAEEKTALDSSVAQLKTAVLRNENIPERAKNFMEGNREEYIKRVQQFASAVQIPEDLDACSRYLGVYTPHLEEFSKATVRPYHILQEFFAHEAQQIAAHVKKIDLLMRLLDKQFSQTQYAQLKALRRHIDDLGSARMMIADLTEQIRAKENELQQYTLQASQLQQEIDTHKQQKAYLAYQRAKDELQQVKSDLEIKESELGQHFMVIETALKKFARISLNEKLVRSYLANAVVALTEDMHLKILDELVQMKQAIRKGTIELKDKKQEKTIETIDALSHEYLSTFLSSYGSLKMNEKKLQETLHEHPAQQALLELLKSSESAHNAAARAKREMNSLKRDRDNVDVKNTIYLIQLQSKEVFGMSLVIV